MSIDRPRWEQLAARMRTRWPGQLSNIKSEAYFGALSDLGKSDLDRAVDVLIASESEELPSPADIRAAASGEGSAAAAAPAGRATPATPEERKIAGIPASWLLSGVVAIVVAVVIVVVFVFVFDDSSASDPPPFEPAAVENELVVVDWGDRTAAAAECEDAEGGAISCVVVFESGEQIDVSVTEGESPGQLDLDIPEAQQGQGGGGAESPGSGQQGAPPSP